MRMTAGLWNGSITTIGSDHCCYDTQQKTSARHDVRTMPNGLPGVELRMPVIFSEFVRKAGPAVERFVELCCTAPAPRRTGSGRGRASCCPAPMPTS